jgi:acyl-coenzyme A thioesterase PaaI-like protein
VTSSDPNSYFRLNFERADAAEYDATAATSGPWDPRLQHGGPPSGLSVRAAERAAADHTGRSDLVAVRFSAEFVGPVPVGVVRVTSRVVRAARSAVLVETVLAAGERDCLYGRTWLVRAMDTTAIAHPPVGARQPAEGLPGLNADFPYARSIEWRAESGNIDVAGPGRVWARPVLPLVDAEPLTGLQRVALVGDSASGISSALDWSVWSFLNVDLDIHLARPVVGDWILLDAHTQLGGSGSALTRSTISDGEGELGCTAQTLVLALRS